VSESRASPSQRRLDEERYFSVRYSDAFSVVLVDVNNLSTVKREHGQAAGDEVLRRAAGCIEGAKRPSDVVARVGDDELGMILQGCDEHAAKQERDRRRRLWVSAA